MLSSFLYIESFDFDRSIEIYKFGATAWPRTLILLMALAALGQLLFQYYAGDRPTGSLGAATDDGAQEAARKAGHSSVSWYASTFLLLAIPFLYMRAPDLVGLATTLDKQGVHLVKGVTAPILLVAYLVLMRGNHVGAILALPIFFAALLEDMGFLCDGASFYNRRDPINGRETFAMDCFNHRAYYGGLAIDVCQPALCRTANWKFEPFL